MILHGETGPQGIPDLLADRRVIRINMLFRVYKTNSIEDVYHEYD